MKSKKTLKHDWGPKKESHIFVALIRGKEDEIHWCSTSLHPIPHGCRVKVIGGTCLLDS